MKRLLALAALATAVVSSGPTRASVSIALVPPFIEKLVRPSGKVVDAVALTNQGTEAVTVSIDLADFQLDEEGRVGEAPPGTQPGSLAPFLRVSPARARVAPGQQVLFRYAVETPAEFSQLRAMIFFSSRPEVEERPNQVVVVPRLGVPLYVESTKAAPASLDVDRLEWSRSEDRLQLRFHVRNSGGRNLRPSGFVQVRSADGSFDRAFDFNAGREPVLPGQSRVWEESYGPVPGGELFVKLRFARTARAAFEAEGRVPAAGSPSAPSSSSR